MTYPELRASDSERERVVSFLREHALLGRLTDDELEERIGLAYAAVTVGHLERLIADLPRGGRPAPPRTPAPRPHPRRSPARRHGPPPVLIGAGIVALIMTGLPFVAVAIAVAIVVTLVAVMLALSFVLGPLILVGVLIVLATRRHRRSSPPMRWGPQY